MTPTETNHTPATSQLAPDELPKQLGVFDTASIYVGIILGSGIFVAPSAIAKVAPGAGGGALLWIIAGLVAAIGAFVYAECGARLPHPGGFYIYYREALGRPVAFVGGWAALAVTYPASLAAIAHLLAQYLVDLVPSAAGHETAVSVIACAVAGVLSAAGIRTGVLTQRFLTALKVVALALLSAAALFSTPHEVEGAVQAAPVGDLTIASVTGAWMVLMWTYDGWSNVSLIASEVRHPKKLLPVAVALGTLALVVLYCLVQLAVVRTLGGSAASSERVFADAVRAGLGSGASRWVSATIVISTFGALAGSVFAGARIGFAMAKDELLPSPLARIDPRLKTPAASIALMTVATILYAAFGGFDALLSLFSFSVWIFYGLCAVCLLILRKRRVGEQTAFKAPGGSLAPVLLLVFAGIMAVGVAVDDPRNALLGTLALLAGLPLYFVWIRLTRRRG